jgi:hypothetical protein
MWKSLTTVERRVVAEDAVLDALYAAARLGMSGDKMALAAGITPEEWRSLRALDGRVELVELKGSADGEMVCAKAVMGAAEGGDVNAALAMLKHRHDWVATQRVEVREGRISVLEALEMADRRVVEGKFREIGDAGTDIHGGGGESADGAVVGSWDSGRSGVVCVDGISVGSEEHAAG